MFDLAVNGGGLLTIEYRKAGYLPVHRQVQARWQDYAWAPDIVLVPYDNLVTAVDLASPAPMQVARGSVVTDADGTRQPTLLISQGTAATITLPDGSSRALSDLHVRATEYTIGTTGPNAMPAPLPPSTAYTYAVELSVDEAVAAGADRVGFDQPISYYMENFLNFPAGMIVPVGYYDRKQGRWIPSRNGRVVRIVGITAGMADLDTDGDGLADDAATLAALGATDSERQKLALLYAPDTSLWRVPIMHFTTYDYNWPYACVGDCIQSPPPTDNNIVIPPSDIKYECGSVIGCQNQTLGESFPATGTPFSLNYSSDRVVGRAATDTVTIPLSGAVVPQGLKRITLEISIVGRSYTYTFDNSANQTFSFTWDRKDAFGRPLQGTHTLTVRIGYDYGTTYYGPPYLEYVFGLAGNPMAGFPTRADTTIWREWRTKVGGWDARGQGLGGWTIDVHHAYDPWGRLLYLGNGVRHSADDRAHTIDRVAGHGSQYNDTGDGPALNAAVGLPIGVTVAADGSYFISEIYHNRVRRVNPEGIINRVAGNNVRGYSGDGGAATAASLYNPAGTAIGPDGSIYIADMGNNRVRRVTPDGIITTVAGTGEFGYGGDGDGGQAMQAKLSYPTDVEIGPDGALYIAEYFGGTIRRVGPDGVIVTVAGGGGLAGDGIQATQAFLNFPLGIALGADGTLYIADEGDHRVRRVTPDGIITTVAGNGEAGYTGDGGPATNARMYYPAGLSPGPNGTLYIADTGNNVIRRVGSDGIIATVAGNGLAGWEGDGGPAVRAELNSPQSVAVGFDGTLLIADYYNNLIRRVSPSLPGFSYTDILMPSPDGREVYHFDGNGRHLRTLNALTAATMYQFTYDPGGNLIEIADADNNATRIERDASGNPTGIVAPGGQRTELSMDANGYLAFIANPAGDNVGLSYKSDGGGLMELLTDQRGYPHLFAYDPLGLLIRDDDPAGGYKTLTRTESGAGGGYEVSVSTALGKTTTYGVSPLPAGDIEQVNTSPTGAQTITRIGANAVSTTWSPDNTVTEVVEGPDPRVGMQAPIRSSSTTWTPGGLVSVTTLDRMAVLADPRNPFSLQSQTDWTTVNGRTYTSTFDNATRQTTTITPAGRQTVSTTDERGRVISVQSDPSVFPTTFTYDPMGRLYQTGQDNNLWTHLYDGRNRLWKKIDPMDNTTEFGYDDADRVNRVILPSGRTYGFAHDNNGNVTSITMPSGAVHGLGYTKINLDNSYTPPGNPSYATGYNLDREWVRTTLPSGRAIDGGYDNGGRLHDVTYPEAAVAMTYFDNTDRVGTLTRASVADNQAIAFSYDGFLTTRVAFSGLANGEYRYAFDNNFWVTGVALDNVWTTVGHDNDGLLTRYGPFTISRNGPAGAPSALTDNVLNISYTYDSSGRPWVRTHTVAGQQVYQLTLGYDNVGRIATKTEVVAGTSHVLDYTYDVDGQLFEVRQDNVLVEQYAYDNNANRTSTLATTATYDDQDRLIQKGGVAYTFDDDGYLTQRGSDTFQYSAKGELLSATVGGRTITYHYDGMGRRIGKTDATGTVQYLYGNPRNPFQVTASRDATGILTTYFYDTAGNLYSFDRGVQRYYVATDQLGTPKAVTDATGAVVKAVEYDAWGVRLSDTNPTFDLPVGFAGGVADAGTALVRFGFRDYEPGTGRWAAKDPVFFKSGQANLFVYSGNNPVNLRDSSGLWTIAIGVAGTAGAGGGVGGGFSFVFDNKGNVGIISSAGGGGLGGISYSAGAQVQVTNANTIYDLNGLSLQSGGSLLASPLGFEAVQGDSYWGVNFNITLPGLSGGLTPVELHSIAEYAAVEGMTWDEALKYVLKLLGGKSGGGYCPLPSP
jgi:RHS repeat-associated protein